MTAERGLGGPLIVERLMLSALLWLCCMMLSAGCAFGGDIPQITNWGINLQKLMGRPPSSDDVPPLVLGVYRHQGRVVLRLAPAANSQSQIHLLDFETGILSDAPFRLGDDYHELKMVQWIEEDGAFISARMVCYLGFLHNYLQYSVRRGTPMMGSQIFIARKLHLSRPVRVEMVADPKKCGVEDTPPPYWTATPIVAGDIVLVNLGDGTALVWDSEWTSEVIRFRIADGGSAYQPKVVTFVNFEDVLRLYSEIKSKDGRFSENFENLLKGGN